MSSPSPGITVTGVGEVVVEPDTGFLDVGVQVSRETVAEAREVAARVASAVIESVKANGVEPRDIQTAAISITPSYEYPREGEPRVTGYQVTNTVVVRVRELDRFSAIIDAAAEAGGDDARINGIRFEREDDDAAVSEARSRAMADARSRAGQLASLAGVNLGRALAIHETTASAGGRPEFAKVSLRAAAADFTPIEAGTGHVMVSVLVRYSIKA